MKVASGEVRVTDTLPTGVTPVGVEFFISPYKKGLFDLAAIGYCSMTGREVACGLPDVSTVPFNPYDDLEMRIAVKVEGAVSGAENEMTASSAGASPRSVKQPLRIGSTAARFGISNYALVGENLDGSVDTQAGSHPFQLTSTLTIDQTADQAHPPALTKDLYFKLPPGLIGNPTAVPVHERPVRDSEWEFPTRDKCLPRGHGDRCGGDHVRRTQHRGNDNIACAVVQSNAGRWRACSFRFPGFECSRDPRHVRTYRRGLRRDGDG